MPPAAIPLRERFERYIQRSPEPDGCWIWTASANRHDYGQLQTRERIPVLVHRLAWTYAHGPIPAGLCVLHRCDVRRCCNPAHLFLGTLTENAADRVQKGRDARGERHGHAKLTDQAVREIRTSAGTNAVIASRFGVSRRQVRDIRAGKYWTHVA